MIKVVVKSLVTAIPIMFLLTVTGLIFKIGSATALFFVLIKLSIDMIVYIVLDFEREER